MLGVGTECPPTIFLYSSHRSLFYGILRAVLGSGVSRSGLVNKRMVGGRLLSVALRLSYMNDTHGDLPRCLFLGLWALLQDPEMYLRGPNNSAHLAVFGASEIGGCWVGGVTECPPTIFLYSSHPKKPAPQPFYGILRAVLGSGVFRSGLVSRRILGGLLSVARLFSYMNDTHGDLPRCLFPRVRAGCLRWFTEPWKQEDVGGGLLSVARYFPI